VNVTGLQKPTQHSKSSMQATLAAVQLAARQSPELHVPSQQSCGLAQLAPGAPHTAARHSPPTQLEPWQHSLVIAQKSPGAVQLPSPIAQRPETHCFEQHAALVVHSSAPATQPQVPLRHWPSQQSLLKRHSEPLARQVRRHCPPSHEPSQHSALAPHGCRSFVHVGGGICTVPHAIALSTTPLMSTPGRMGDTLAK
jgi:hypothetical protein